MSSGGQEYWSPFQENARTDPNARDPRWRSEEDFMDQKMRNSGQGRDWGDESDRDTITSLTPAWAFKGGEWVTPSAPQPSYQIYNPHPPRNGRKPYVYLNHHLVPPSSSGASKRTSFPPSFPPSDAPLPMTVPSSPFIPGKPRISAFYDMVDILDGTDPHGAKWHHQSPYDFRSHTHSSAHPTSTDQPQEVLSRLIHIYFLFLANP